jgi:hypothetical protein
LVQSGAFEEGDGQALRERLPQPSVAGSANIIGISDSNYVASNPSMREVIASAMVWGSKLNLRRSDAGTS